MLKQYKEAIENSNIVSKTDTEGIITFVNDEFCKISGYTKEELIGQNHNIVRHPDVPARVFKELWEKIKAKETYIGTVKNLSKDGSVFYLNTTVIPILDDNENIVEFIAIRYDVTKEVFYKQKLEKKEKELQELNTTLEKRVFEKTKQLKKLNETLENRIKKETQKNEEKQKVMFWQSRLASLGEMLANIAHQWRQPLTELSLTLYAMKNSIMQDNKDEAEEYYRESKKIIKNMSDTIDDFTNFFRPDKEKHCFKVSESINEALSILEKIITKEMINIKVEVEVEDVEVLGIANELSQVIINLIRNSKDAFVQNGILIREMTIKTKKENGFVVIEVWDNAGGIKEKNIYKIFEPYFTTKHKSHGTGLGLFMSKMICEQGLGGSLDVRSKKQATVFSIKIPLQEDLDEK